MTVLVKRASQLSIEPVCPARLAAARLRRACWGPILAPPPVRAIQTSFRKKQNDEYAYLGRNLLELQADKSYMKGNLTDLF
jgi:hypothetical protein